MAMLVVGGAIAISSLTILSDAIAADNNQPAVWNPDNGDGTYKNPIIYADYSDPDVIRVGDDFYMTASSFSCFPGLPILHSKDPVNWTIIGHAIPKHPVAEQFAKPFHGGGIWAPAIRFHDGVFYIFVGDPDNGVYVLKSKNPAGPWDPPILIKQAKGWIDTCPFWDDDGQAYMVHAFANSRAGVKNILHINRISPDGTKLLDDGKLVVDGNKDSTYNTIEGPKLYKRNNYYYIMAPGGGVSKGYQIVFRSKNIYGPYESRIVLDSGKTNVNGPHQGGWVETQAGERLVCSFSGISTLRPRCPPPARTLGRRLAHHGRGSQWRYQRPARSHLSQAGGQWCQSRASAYGRAANQRRV